MHSQDELMLTAKELHIGDKDTTNNDPTMQEVTDKALCPRCGGEQFTIELGGLGNVKAICTECEWQVDPDDFQEACDTPQDKNGNTLK